MKFYHNCQQAFIGELKEVMACGEDITVRGNVVKEITNACFTILNPEDRCLFIPGRKDNIFAKIAETMWVLSGRSDIEWLTRYLPRAIDFSDDGKFWRAGYGPRLRKWSTMLDETDQVAEVIRLLNEDRYTRRAVMSLWDPSSDYVDSKDIPCNNWLNFYIRNDLLHLNVAQRSSDVLWGLSGINLFEWSVLMELIANSTNSHVGTLTYFISNLHLYERHWSRASNMLDDWDKARDVYIETHIQQPYFDFNIDESYKQFAKFFDVEQQYRCNDFRVQPNVKVSNFSDMVLTMIKAYNLYLNQHPVDEIAKVVDDMPGIDFKFAAIEFFSRKLGAEFISCLRLGVEKSALLEMFML